MTMIGAKSLLLASQFFLTWRIYFCYLLYHCISLILP